MGVATRKPVAPTEAPEKAKSGSQDDNGALVVWNSALTKFDCLEAYFARGEEAKKLIQIELIDQISKDLVKDYGAKEKDAQQRAKRIVMTEMGKRFGTWKKSLAGTSDS